MANHKRGGRPPTPTHLKILAGNPGKRDLPANEPKPEAGIPDCPERFVAAQKAAFEKLGGQLNQVGVLTHLDGPALEVLAMCYSQTMASAAEVAKYGPCWVSMAGCLDANGKVIALPKTKINPQWKVLAESMRQLRSMLQEFGMTPSSRTKVSVVGEEDTDDLDDFIQRNA